MPVSRRRDETVVGEIREKIIDNGKKMRAAAPPSEVANPFRSELKWPIMKTKKVSNAERAGDEKEENNKAMAVRIASSK